MGPAFLRDHLLPHGRLSGWSNDWFVGFPAYHSYFVLPALAIVGLDALVPYNVAFKVVVAAGPIALTVACYLLGRALGLRRPAPALLSVAAVAVLCNREPRQDSTGDIIGGNLGSTLSGEFSYSLSLALAVFAAAAVVRLVRTGRGRTTAALLLAATGLCHVVPAVLAVTASLLAVAVYGRRRAAVLDLVTIGGVAGLLGAFWALPFLARRHLLQAPGFDRLDGDGLFSAIARVDVRWILSLALAGAVLSIARRAPGGVVLTGLATLSLAVVVVLPETALWNARFLAPWYLSAAMLAALGVAELGRAAGELSRRGAARARIGEIALPLAVALAVVGNAGLHLAALPGTTRLPDGGLRWMGADVALADVSPYRGSARFDFDGYERQPWWPDLQAFVDTVHEVVRAGGCGRVLVEESAVELRDWVAPAPQLLPHWTDGCVTVADGLWGESSTTRTAVADVVADLFSGPDRPPGDADRGVAGLRTLGVRWFAASTRGVVRALLSHPDTELVAGVGKFRVFEIAGAELVVPLRREPVVVTGAGWRQVASSWRDALDGEPLRAADGPPSWARVDASEAGEAPGRLLPATSVSAVRLDDGSLEFDVAEPGIPVLVRVSWFPGWKARGAEGPFRVAPNLMVVIPTATHVTLRFGPTALDPRPTA